MRPLLVRLLLAATLSALMGGLIVPMAAGWHEQPPVCDTTTGACVSQHDNYVSPRAVNCCFDDNWTNDVYPNTGTTLNDTVSSVRNRFSTLDILFYKQINRTGELFCLDAGDTIDDLGAGPFSWDDVISSNSVVSNGCT